MKAKVALSEARFAYEGLDHVLHERARLSVPTSLIANPKGLAFGDLKQLCALTDGDLSRHLRVLEKGKMVGMVKEYHGNRPQTVCHITASGRERCVEYLSTFEPVVREAAKITKEGPATGLIRGLAPSRA